MLVHYLGIITNPKLDDAQREILSKNFKMAVLGERFWSGNRRQVFPALCCGEKLSDELALRKSLVKRFRRF